MTELLITAVVLWFLGLAVVFAVVHRGLQRLCEQPHKEQPESVENHHE